MSFVSCTMNIVNTGRGKNCDTLSSCHNHVSCSLGLDCSFQTTTQQTVLSAPRKPWADGGSSDHNSRLAAQYVPAWFPAFFSRFASVPGICICQTNIEWACSLVHLAASVNCGNHEKLHRNKFQHCISIMCIVTNWEQMTHSNADEAVNDVTHRRGNLLAHGGLACVGTGACIAHVSWEFPPAAHDEQWLHAWHSAASLNTGSALQHYTNLCNIACCRALLGRLWRYQHVHTF